MQGSAALVAELLKPMREPRAVCAAVMGAAPQAAWPARLRPRGRLRSPLFLRRPGLRDCFQGGGCDALEAAEAGLQEAVSLRGGSQAGAGGSSRFRRQG